jgi:hypothetical protein
MLKMKERSLHKKHGGGESGLPATRDVYLGVALRHFRHQTQANLQLGVHIHVCTCQRGRL